MTRLIVRTDSSTSGAIKVAGTLTPYPPYETSVASHSAASA